MSEGVVVSAYHEGVCGSLEVTSPGFEGVDNTKEFLFSGAVVDLGLGEFATLIGDGSAVLEKDGPDTDNTGIGLHDKSFVRVWVCQDRCRAQCRFDGFKRVLALVGPGENVVLPGLRRERGRKCCVIWKEFAKVICESQELPVFTGVLGSRHIADGLNLFRVNFNAVCTDDMSKIVKLMLKKLAFGQLAVQAFLADNVEDLAQVVQMLVLRFGENEDIV